MSNTYSSPSPLIPMSDIFTSSTNSTAAAAGTAGTAPTSGIETSNDARQPPNKSTKGTSSYSPQDVIDSEIANLTTIQSNNNDEIKIRLTDIQRLRENNLVVVGAIGGLKKIKEKL